MSQVKGKQQIGALDKGSVDTSALLEQADNFRATQAALLESTPLESQYSAIFIALLETKHHQAARIEDKIERLIEAQSSRLQQAKMNQPGLFSLPGARARWQQNIQIQQTSIQKLQVRLEAVKEIKDGMGFHAPRIEELATRKLRAQEPELASAWDDMQEAQRHHQVLLRKKELEKRQTLEREKASRGIRLDLSQQK